MKASEVQLLLTTAAAFDNRKTDPTGGTALTWQKVLADVDYADAEAAVIAHQTGPLAGEYLTVKHIVDAVEVANRSTRKLVEADVRSARARRIVPADWPESQPLTAELAARLAAARAADRESAEVLSVGAVGGVAGDLGVIVKTVP